MALSIGDLAPDFTLNDQTRTPVTLSDLRGSKNVLVVFYPLAFSVDSSAATAAWAAKEGYEFPLLSDFWPHGAVAEQYGVFDAAIGLAQRGTFLVDKEGVIRFAEVNPIPEARDQQRWRDALRELGAAV